MPPTSDDLQPSGSGASTSTSTPGKKTEELLTKFADLGKEEEHEDDGDDSENDGEEGKSGAVDGDDDPRNTSETQKKNKKKKKGKTSKAISKLKTMTSGQAPQELVDAVRENMDTSEQGVTDDDIRKAMKAADLMKMLDGHAALGRKSNTKALGEHKTQPVPQFAAGSERGASEGPIDPIKTPADVKQEPGALPSGFEWCLVDVGDEEQIKELYILLSENYVEDDEAMFRFAYTKEFLLWALTAPGYLPEWHVGVRVQKTGKLVAFISGIKVELRVRAKTFNAAEINFLCVHKKLRSKRLAPVLIKEVTRRCNVANVWQAIYTAGVVLPTPFGTCRYYHRNLNPPKLVDIGFSPLPRGSTIAKLVKQFGVGSVPRIPGFREMVRDDVPQVGDLLRRYLARFEIAQTFASNDEIDHWFISGLGKEVAGKRVEQVVWAYVVEDPTTRLITDMVSFYSLPSSIMKHKKHTVLNAAYMFYYASDTIFSPGGSADDAATHEAKALSRLGERLNSLVGDLLIMAQNAGFDVLNALTMLDNNMFLADQKFGAGDGFLNYYLYNWACAPINGGDRSVGEKKSAGIGVVML